MVIHASSCNPWRSLMQCSVEHSTYQLASIHENRKIQRMTFMLWNHVGTQLFAIHHGLLTLLPTNNNNCWEVPHYRWLVKILKIMIDWHTSPNSRASRSRSWTPLDSELLHPCFRHCCDQKELHGNGPALRSNSDNNASVINFGLVVHFKKEWTTISFSPS